MLFGPKKGSPVYMFENFFKDFAILIAALVIALIKGDFSIFTENLVMYVFYFFGPIRRLVIYLTTLYSVDDHKLIVTTGWLQKKKQEIPLATITTVDFTQNILHQVTRTYRVKVDNGSSVSGTDINISMTFGRESAFELKELLKPGESGIDGFNLESGTYVKADADAEKYTFSVKDVLIMGAIKSKFVFLIQMIALVSGAFSFITKIISIDDKKFHAVATMLYHHYAIGLLVFACIIGIYIIAIICGAVGSFLKYYDFVLYDTGDSLKVQYGFFTKKNFTIQKNRVSGFYYEQSIIMKWLNIGTLHCFAIGYGSSSDGESREDPILVPLLKSQDLRKFMTGILPEMAAESEVEKPLKTSWYYFLYSGYMYFAIPFLAFCIYLYEPGAYIMPALGALVMVLSLTGVLLTYKNASISGNCDNVSITYGSYKKTTVFVKTSNIESVTDSSSYFKHKKGVTNVKIGYIAPIQTSGALARNISVESFEHIRSLLIY